MLAKIMSAIASISKIENVISIDLQVLTGIIMSADEKLTKDISSIVNKKQKRTKQQVICDELKKMGADIDFRDGNAVVKGVKRLKGAEVYASDLRCGAALIAAGLSAEGRTKVYGTEFIDRGYENIEKVLRKIGADIKRLS